MAAPAAQEPPGWEEDLAWLDRDPMTAVEREAWLDRLCAQDDDPADAPQEYWDPESCAPPPGQDELTAGELAGVAEAASDEMLALDAASTGRRGPGQSGSARTFPGEAESKQVASDPLEEASMESFPASDPPASMHSTTPRA